MCSEKVDIYLIYEIDSIPGVHRSIVEILSPDHSARSPLRTLRSNTSFARPKIGPFLAPSACMGHVPLSAGAVVLWLRVKDRVK